MKELIKKIKLLFSAPKKPEAIYGGVTICKCGGTQIRGVCLRCGGREL
jgi:hypothetical protein